MPALGAVQINEFMAHNPGRPVDPDALLDMDGNSPGWIELYNNSPTPVVLTGWALSDDPLAPGKWVFADPVGPAVAHTIVPGNGYRVVFCGGLARNIANVEAHADFSLDDSGVVLLSQPDGNGGWTVVSQIGTTAVPYPSQRNGVSFGYPGNDTTKAPVYFESDTPGASNGLSGVAAFCEEPAFSVPRGFMNSPFTLSITTTTPGATIAFTTNGDLPTSTHGTQVAAADADSAPVASVSITGTAIIRARVWKPGMGASHPKTHTYIFASDVLHQTGPLPSMGLSDADTFNWGASGGDLRSPAGPDWAVDPDIVNHATAGNRFTIEDLKKLPVVSVVTGWVEAFGPKSTAGAAPPVDKRGFYVGAAVGVANEGADRSASMEYINPDGNSVDPNASRGFQTDGMVHVFGGTSQNRWKSYKLSMRFRSSETVRFDVYGRDASAEQDLFILDARLNQSWVHPDGTQQSRGDYVRDHVMADLQNAMGGATFHSRPVHYFLNGLYWGLYILHEKPDDRFMADYLGGDPEDWDVFKHSGGNGVDGGRLIDNVISSGVMNPSLALGSTADSTTSAFFNSTTLRNFEDLLDRVGLGRVAPNPAVDLKTKDAYEAVAAKLDIPGFIDYMLLNFVAANQDWAHKNLYASYRRNDPNARWRWHSWDAEHVFRTESENSVTKSDQYGPTAIHQKLMANLEYRLAFGDAIHRRIFNQGILSTAGLRAAFNRRFAEIEPSGVRGESARWGDNRIDTKPYTYLGAWTTEKNRILDVICAGRGSTAATPSTTALNQMRSAGLYPATPAPEFRNDATDTLLHGGRVEAGFRLKLHNPGVPAAEVYYTLDGTDPRVPWTSEVAPGALRYTGPLLLDQTVTVKSRARNGSVWSALDEAYFSVATEPASASNLVVSELHYRPAAPGPAEEAAGFTQRSRFEFVELMNISRNRVSLDGVRFAAGFDYTFDGSSAVRELAPGARVLIVAHPAAFSLRYGPGKPVTGSFQLGSNLDDSGERIQLLAADGSVILEFTYDDQAPWPASADGEGYSLVLNRPESNPDPTNPSNWRPSRAIGGSPGGGETTPYEDWKAANAVTIDDGDEDADGAIDLYEYLGGTDPHLATSRPVLFASLSTSESGAAFQTLTFLRDPHAKDVEYVPEFSDDLKTWFAEGIRVEVNPRNDGLQAEIWRRSFAVGGSTGFFVRLRMTPP